MISIVWQGDHRYNVYRSGQDIGCVIVSSNPYRNHHCYLNPGFDQYDPAIAKELFSLLRKELGQPLQVMLYSTHEAVSPLTVPQDVFCTGLPGTVVCCIEDGKPIHYAFVELGDVGYKIAYVGTTVPSNFYGFAQSLVWKLFQKCDFLTMECDGTDLAAMELKSLFRVSNTESYGTYILK